MKDAQPTLATARKKAHARLLSLGSPVYAAFLAMEKAAFTDDALPRQGDAFSTAASGT